MFKTTVTLDDHTRNTLRELAVRHDSTRSQILRDAVMHYAKTIVAVDLPPGIGSYESGTSRLTRDARSVIRTAARARGLRRGL